MPFFTISLVLLSDVQFLPISGLCGANMKTRMDKSICSWWDGPCLFEALDRIEVPLRDPRGPVRFEGYVHAHLTFFSLYTPFAGKCM
jgi:sulfate adenylyltransferase subunit 1 (EFTu-like GTPase family)